MAEEKESASSKSRSETPGHSWRARVKAFFPGKMIPTPDSTTSKLPSTPPPKAASAEKDPARKKDSPRREDSARRQYSDPSKAPEPNMAERMRGLQGWMTEIERRQGRMTYFGAAAVLLAVAAAAAALYLAVTTNNDAATKADLDEIQQQMNGIQQAVKRATEQQLKGVSETVGSLDQRIEDLKKKQAQDARDITTLQGRVNSLRTSGAAGTGGAGAGGGGAGGGGAGGGGAGGGDAGNLSEGGVGP